MKASTHVGFAGLVYLVLLTPAGVRPTALNSLAVAVASVLPDIDSGASYIGRVVPLLTRFLERRYGHRTLTHSLPFLAFLVILSLVPLLAGIDLFACVLVGYASHPFLDTCTPAGVRLFYPFSSVRCVFPFDANSPHRFRVDTGSKLDMTLGFLFFVACLPAYYVASEGYERFIRLTQHSIESAVRDYEEYAPSAVVFAAIDAHDQLSGERLKGTYRILGALNGHTLVFEHRDGSLHTAGREFESDYVADNIVCSKGEPARATVRTVDMSGRFLGGLMPPGDSAVESLFFGEVLTAEEVSVPAPVRRFSPVICSGRRIRLNFARWSDLRDLNLGWMLVNSGKVIVKSIGEGSVPAASGSRSETPQGGTLLAYPLNPGESVDMKKKKGDTVKTGEILAVRIVPTAYGEQQGVNEERRANTGARDRTSLEDLDRAAAASAVASGSDSLEFANALELVRRGYASPVSLRKAELKSIRSRRALGKLVAARDIAVRRMALDSARCALAEAELRVKAGLHALKSEIRSPFPGILIDVIRDLVNGKERIVFCLRRLPS
jgi:membrane-bound metal-dependent hydrolase YbcI (DUF457 family)